MRRPALLRDQRGVTMVEFALVAPVLILLIMGLFDIGHGMYTRSVLEGELQKAARDGTFEQSADVTSQAALDARVRGIVKKITGNNAAVTFTRTSYDRYRRAEVHAEDFVDSNANNICDNGEAFEDSNGNGVWSPDATVANQGGAKDVQVYRADVSYPRLFPMAKLLGWSSNINISATTLLRNQPYTNQATVKKGTCPV